MQQLSRHYDYLSLVYDALDWPFETFRYPRIRRLMCGDLKGKVLEAGVGTGKNLKYYPAEAEVTGVDVSEGMLMRARRRAQRARCPVKLKRMDATKLEFPDACFDVCVATYLFCVLPDALQQPVLKELLRVTKPDGQVRILEHRYSRRSWRRALMKAYTPYVKWFFQSRYDHPIGDAVRASDARILEERYVTADIEKLYVLSPNHQGNGAPSQE